MFRHLGLEICGYIGIKRRRDNPNLLALNFELELLGQTTSTRRSRLALRNYLLIYEKYQSAESFRIG